MSKVLARFSLLTLLLSLLVSSSRAQTPITGDWKGTLSAGGNELHLIFHISADKDGKFSATIDSVDQGANGIPVSSVSLNGSKLNMTIDAVHGTYEGTVSADGASIVGTWSQGTPLELNLTRGEAPKPAASIAANDVPIAGTWTGSINTGAFNLSIIIKIATGATGLTAQLQSPDQSQQWIAADSITRNGSSVTMEFKVLKGTYEGKLSADGVTMDGTFTQLGTPLPLSLKHVKDQSEVERRRPQNPVKPYPYHEEDVTFPSSATGVTLAGTVTVPQGKGPFPAVVLISGSGPNDRDETLLEHKPFLVLSDYLTRKGIVVLRYDKRGVGKSTGKYAMATTADFADDAEAALRYLKTRSEADPHHVGLIGHSEGGAIAPIVAARSKNVDFIVLMAGPGVPGDQILVEQHRLIALAMGLPPDEVDRQATREKTFIELVEREKDNAVVEKEIRAKMGSEVPEAQISTMAKELTSVWFRYFFTYDPATSLRKVQCPVLALNGSLDLQVPPKQNLPAIRKALEEGGNKHYEIDELPGLNHLFQTAKSGAPNEYAEIEETISPVVLDKITTWVLKQ
jgi:pimeloyl-ACP methyl ester carboxylesterase